MTEPTGETARTSLLPGIGGAVLGAVVGAVAWAVLVSVSNYKIGFAAIGVGALAGFLAGRLGGGAPHLPWIAAVIGLAGCLLGDLLADAHQASVALTHEVGRHISTVRVFREMVSHPHFGWDVYKTGFAGLDVLFYAIAAQAAWRLAAAHRPVAAPPQPMAPPPAEGTTGSPFDITPPPVEPAADKDPD